MASDAPWFLLHTPSIIPKPPTGLDDNNGILIINLWPCFVCTGLCRFGLLAQRTKLFKVSWMRWGWGWGGGQELDAFSRQMCSDMLIPKALGRFSLLDQDPCDWISARLFWAAIFQVYQLFLSCNSLSRETPGRLNRANTQRGIYKKTKLSLQILHWLAQSAGTWLNICSRQCNKVVVWLHIK